MEQQPQDITQVFSILDPGGRAHLRPLSDNFFLEMEADFPDFAGHILFSSFSFDKPWETWELHPLGDEIVYLLSGDTDLLLHDGEKLTATIRLSKVNEYVVVPKGVWHKAVPHVATTMLFFTPGKGTINATEPGGTPQ